MTTQSYNTTDLLTLIGHDVPLRKVANTHGGEYCGPCPFCKTGDDRFRVWPYSTRGSWWCRMCDKRGDAIQYLRESGLSYADACKQLGRPIEHEAHAQPLIPPPVECRVPSMEWRATGAGLILWAQGHVEQALDYLHGRGLNDKTIASAGLGYIPSGRWSERRKWGLPVEIDPDTKQPIERVWIPQGIVIPWYADQALWKITIRRDVVKHDQDRYKTLPGSSNALYGADSLQPNRPAVLTEGPFDALAVQQEAGDTLSAVASGTSGARRIRWITQLALASQVLIALDADDAGDHASRYWLDVLPNGKRWRPYYSDPSQMLQDGQDVRGWLLAGMGTLAAPWATADTAASRYWRDEVRLGSVALDRLARICREQGYDYQATLEALR